MTNPNIYTYMFRTSVAGASGAAVMGWNAGAYEAFNNHKKGPLGGEAAWSGSLNNINTKDLNFMGFQDFFIAGALLIAFSSLAYAAYLRSNDTADGSANNNETSPIHPATKWFVLGGTMLVATATYAFTATLFDAEVPYSKIGHFEDMSFYNATIFGGVYFLVGAIGAGIASLAVDNMPKETQSPRL